MYDGNGLLLHERGSMGTRDYICLNGEPVALVKNGELYYIHNDHLGRPEAASDANGVSAWSIEANAWSGDTPIGGLWAFNLRFPGQYFDTESRRYYNYFRTYDPGTGRYLESDPIGLAGGLNTYSYVGGNPLSFVDPFGLAPNFLDYFLCKLGKDSISQKCGARLMSKVIKDKKEALGKATVEVASEVGKSAADCAICIADATVGITPESMARNAAEQAGVKGAEKLAEAMGESLGQVLGNKKLAAKAIARTVPGLGQILLTSDAIQAGICVINRRNGGN